MAFLQSVVQATTIALSAAVAKTVAGCKAPSNQVLKILESRLSHDGANSANAPSVVDLADCTFATNGPGTNSSSYTPKKEDPGRAETIQQTAATNWTSEPTTITPRDTVNVGEYNGLYHYISPQMAPRIVVGGQGWVVRANSPAVVNATVKILTEE